MRTREFTAPIVACVLLFGCNGQSHQAKKTARSSTSTTTTPAPPSSTTIPYPSAVSPVPVVYNFDPQSLQCTPALSSAIARNWQVSAPRTTQSEANSVPVRLRNKMEGPTAQESAAGVTGDPSWALPAPNSALTAQITTPDGATYESRSTQLLPDPPTSWISVNYPGDFPNAPALIAGTYTVVWNAPAGSLACDGFTIA